MIGINWYTMNKKPRYAELYPRLESATVTQICCAGNVLPECHTTDPPMDEQASNSPWDLHIRTKMVSMALLGQYAQLTRSEYCVDGEKAVLELLYLGFRV